MIRIEGLTYAVPGGRQVLRDVWLNVPEGKTVGVMGMSGTGKTSLLRCIAGLVQPVAGRIWLMGRQVVGLSEREWVSVREHIGYVFQYAALFDSLTVFENVAFGPRRQGIRDGKELSRLVSEKLSLVGLDGTQSLYPSELSGGMKKRVGLARALALNPRILLYDEPTSGLDPITAGVIDDLIAELRDRIGVTSVVVSHDVEGVFRVSDVVAMLYEGRVIFTGSPEQARSTDNPYVRQFIEGQAKGPISVT